MMSKTHYAVGLATSLAVIQPKTINECLTAVIAGTIGGVLADNDILDNDYQADALIGQLLAAGTTALAVIFDYLFKLGICLTIVSRPILSIIGGVGFVVLWFVGFFSDHRTFTHSLTALALYSLAVWLIYPPILLGFAVAYFSHLFLDILNKKKVPILYPFEFGICLKMCYANKTANKVFMYIGFAASGILLIISVIVSLV